MLRVYVPSPLAHNMVMSLIILKVFMQVTITWSKLEWIESQWAFPQ